MAPILRTIVGVGISAALAFGMMPVASAAEDARADEDCTVHTSAVPASSADGDPSVGASASFGQTDLKENSWRYQNGELIPEEDGSDGDSSAAARAGEAWSLSEYGYLSSDGSVIEGALNKGIDVSEHQGWIDWEKVKADGIDFAIIRCGYGSDYASQDDDWWEYNVSECERLGIPYGVYLYSYAQNPEMARSEADHALRLLEGHHPTIPVFFDMEDSSTFIYNEDGSINLSASRKNFGDMAEIFCEAMENAGYWAGVYANLTWFNTYLTDERFELYMRWVAQYNNSCWYDGQYMFWQCTSSAYVDGVDGPVDLNFEYFGFCYPSDGTSAVPDGVSLVKGCPNEENAKLFIDFVTSRECQEAQSQKWGRRPVRNDMEVGEGMLPLNELTLVDYDFDWAANEKETIIERFNDIMVEN